MTRDSSFFDEGKWESLFEHGWVPRGINPEVPNVARIYDYQLGGKDNYAVDRAMAQKVTEQFPLAPQLARANREFLQQMVQYLAEEGIRQFIDVGSGLPTQRNVHEVAREVSPDCRVVYVDNDPVVVRHAQALLPGERGRTAVLEADLCDPDAILNHPSTQELLDFSQPVAVLMFAVLHFVPDEADPHAAIARFREVMAPGSYLVITHAGGDSVPGKAQIISRNYKQASAALTYRTSTEVRALFDGLEILEPGIVPFGQWRDSSVRSRELRELLSVAGMVGVGRKP